MKKIITCLALILPGLFLISCSGLDLSKIDVGPDDTVAWDDAVTVITKGKVKHVIQAHNLSVRIYMKDGTSYKTMEPQIDEVIRVIRNAGKEDKIGIITQ